MWRVLKPMSAAYGKGRLNESQTHRRALGFGSLLRGTLAVLRRCSYTSQPAPILQTQLRLLKYEVNNISTVNINRSKQMLKKWFLKIVSILISYIKKTGFYTKCCWITTIIGASPPPKAVLQNARVGKAFSRHVCFWPDQELCCSAGILKTSFRDMHAVSGWWAQTVRLGGLRGWSSQHLAGFLANYHQVCLG